MAKHNFALEFPLNNSLEAKISKLFLRTVYEIEKNDLKHENWFLFPTTDVDFSSDYNDEHFNIWLMHQAINGRENYNRNIPSFKIAKLDNCLNSVSYKSNVLSFYELDSPTNSELNSARQSKIHFPSSYSKDIFKEKGLGCSFIPIPFDYFNFSNLETNKEKDDLIVFSIQSEFQAKRHHAKTIKAWAEKYGNNQNYVLQCAINNKALSQPQNKQISEQILKSVGNPSNIKFYTIDHYNDWNRFINNADILISMSGGESFNYYDFNGVAIGKHAIVLNAHSNKDWANEDNCCLVSPTKKAFVYDNLFYLKGHFLNQGSVFDFDVSDFLKACDYAVERLLKNKVNENGFLLQQKYSKESFVNNVINILSQS